MNELKEKLKQLGITDEQIEPAIQAVANYVKSKLPEKFQPAVDDILAGKSPDLGGLLGGLGGLFGK